MINEKLVENLFCSGYTYRTLRETYDILLDDEE